MVFEAVVVELLNKFLKQYVENLDTSQLKIGIWGGDVVLKDLKIKATIFDDWNLPVRVKWGKLGKFAMKIPWKNLYSGQVSVNVEDLLVVVIPNTEFVYDPVKEEKWAFERKQAKLKAIEEARKKELDPDSATEQDSFIEKLITQIIKNIHVVINNIHVRYEDKTTIPNSPVSIGVTLSNLSAITTATDPSGYFTKMLKDNKNYICKLLNLEGLSIYWNSNSELYSSLTSKEITKNLIYTIPKSSLKPKNMYVFGPLTSAAFLRLNPRPEIDGTNFTVPKIFVQILLKEIDLAITHRQFCDFMDLLDDSRRLQAANKYKKYRPVGIPVQNHAKEWWHFAYKCVSEDIIRRKSEWSWETIKKHRALGKRYSELYKLKLTQQRKMTLGNSEELNKLERRLSLLNLILIREQVQLEVERDRLNESKSETKKGGWFSGWFGSSKVSIDSTANSDELVRKIESVLTPSEKEKLYKAIGYEENAPFAKYPPTFVEFQFWFHLEEIKMTLYDDRTNHLVPIMTVSVKNVRTEFERRSSAHAYKLVAVIGNFQVTGKADKLGRVPELVTSSCKKSESLVEVLWETKPLDVDCDHRVHVNALPLKIVYHAKTINLVRETFTTDVKEMEKIVSATSASLPTFQKITSLGLEYAIEKRAVLEVKVNVKSSYIIIPYEGEYHQDKEMLVIMLGSVTVETENTSHKDVSVKKLYLEGTTDEEIFSTVVSASYTDFKFRLTGVQILFQLSGEDWVAASKLKGPSSMRFLESTNLDIDLKKSLVTDDARIPKIIIRGILPNLTFNLSEKRFVSFVALICSIPMSSENVVAKKAPSTWSLQSLSSNLENKLKDIPLMKPVTEFTQGIDLIGQFEVKAMIVNVSRTKAGSQMEKKEKFIEDEKFLKLQVSQMEVDITSKTFEALYLLKIGGISFEHHKQSDVVSVLSSSEMEANHYLLTVELINLNTKIPDFFTKRQGIVNRLTISTAPLNVLINKEALLAELQFVRHIQMRVDAVKKGTHVDRLADSGRSEEFEVSGKDEKKVIAKGKRFRKKSQKEVIDLLLIVAVEKVNVNVDFEESKLCEFSLRGARLNIANRKSCVNLDFTLKEIFLLDLNPLTSHQKIIASLEEQTMFSRITIYNKDYFGNQNTVDSSIEAEVSLIQLTFVNIFFARAFEFLNAFQSQIESLKEGASVAAQRAKENLLSAYQNQAQVCLNIQITAPILVVPKLSTSLEAIILDMGVLTIKNTIHELDTILDLDKVPKRPLIDTIKCNLQNLKLIRRSCYDDSASSQYEKTFVVPVTLDVSVKRNLSVGWFKGIPDLEVNAHLRAIHIKLTHQDICATASIFWGNINESLEVWEYERSTRLKKERKHIKEKEMKALQMSQNTEETRESKELQDTTNRVLIKFVFYMDSIRFDAILEKEDGKEESEGLGTFILETISLKGTMYSGSSIEMYIMLASCVLDDTRPGKQGRLTRLMERTVDLYVYEGSDENTINSMIQIKYTKEALNTFVDVKVYKFTLILSMDFLQKLWEFFALDEPFHPSVESKSKQSPRGQETVPVEQNPTFTFNIRLEKPDIIIVESMDSIDTDALVFHAEMVAKFRLAGSRRIINATLTDIEVYSCCFNPAKRHLTLSQVIKPFSISVAGSTPEGRGLHVDVCLTEVAITINPHTIDLLTKCNKAFFKDQHTHQDTPDEMDYSDLWEVTEFDMSDYWFLKPEQGIDALMHRESIESNIEDVIVNDQVCLIAIPSIVLTIEDRSFKRSIPLLLIEMGYQMQCYNWSKKLSINNSLTLQMQYYNKSQTAWEPFIEPVEVNPEKEELHSYTPWELTCTVETEEEGEIDFFQPPKYQISLSCADILQLTVTKTGLKALQTVLDSYSAPVKHEITKPSTRETVPIIIMNKTGLKAEIMLLDSNLEMCKNLDDCYDVVTLGTNSDLELQIISEPSRKKPSKLSKNVIKIDSVLNVKFPLCSKRVFQLPLGISSKRYYPFPVEGKEFKEGEVWGLVSDIAVVEHTTRVILRSIIRIRNDFNEPVHIYLLADNERETHFVGTAERHSLFPLPFQAIYNRKKQLFFTVNGYSLSTKPFHWEQMKSELNPSVLLQCNSKAPESNDPFFMQVVGEVEHIYYANTKRKTLSSVCYVIHLQPTVKIFNSLPVPLGICFQGVAKEKTLLPGNTLQITNAEPGLSTLTLMIYDYLEKNWSCKEHIQENPPEYFVWKFTSYNGLSPEMLNLGVRVTYKRNTAVYAIYCPYFMVNKTEYLLAYKFDGNTSVFYHPGDYKPPVMFTPSAKKFFSKKFAYLQVGHSNWSDKFPVDVAGSGGTIECEDSERNAVYMISVTINLTKNSLTKIVTFTPYYIFVNSAPYDIEVTECYLKDNSWLSIPSGSCVPFWPQSREKEKTIKARPKGSSRVSPPFAYRSTDNVLLRLDHKYGGIFVDIQATNSGTYIMFQQYEYGQAPVLIINDSGKSIVIAEKDTKHTVTLQPKQQVFHAWIAPTKTRHLFVKNTKHSKDVLIINKEETGLIFTSTGVPIRYVSFLDGVQRTLLFTEEENLVRNLSSIKTTQPLGFELACKINGVGLSLVNDLTRVEILYLSLVSTSTSWEVKKPGKTRFVKMKEEKVQKLETAYQKYLDDLEVKEEVDPVVPVTEKLLVNFEKMEAINPRYKRTKQLRRVFEPGLWAAYRNIDGQVMIHMKINRVQVDNQLLDCVFPIILTPVPPPKTIVAELKRSRSFLELSILKTSEEQTGVAQYKYFKILVQEFHVKVDIGFIQNVYEFLALEETTDEEEKEKFRKELELTQRGLLAHVQFSSSAGRKNFYELLHFSPLKIHFSFSLAGTFDSGGTLPPGLSVIFQSLGVTLTDMHDVIFRLSFFERKSSFLTNKQLVSEVISHYYGQTIRQAYVLLLGLDVIGNPYGLIVGIGEGVEAFFYEPFQGIVQGPSDFAAGVAIGCKRFFKGTVGSTAGTLEKLTGTLGKGLAALSMDKDYQMQRIENSQREETIHASMARGGRELFMGVVDGLTGVVRKPIAGAKEEGVGGFFKGMGKGMMGLVTRPVTGVVDFASTSLNAVKRATVGVYGVKRVRPPRFFRDECLVQPYHFYDAKGNLLLYSLCKRRYCKTDKYEYFFEMKNKEFVILTNKRVILAEFNETFESWQEHMSILWKSMPECPRYHSKGVALTLRHRKKKDLAESKSEVKILLIDDAVVRERMHKKMVELYNLEKEQEIFR